jgi:large subunit ribosomal protein L9
MVRMPDGPLKHVGDFPLVLALHTDVPAHIVVSVQGDTTTPTAG